MILTKDNILRFVQQYKYTTPTTVAREFDTTTTIASAALGELADGINLETTHIKFGTTPYYYDPKQKECLEEIAQKSFSDNELELFNKIRKEQIVSLNTLTIPQRSIISKLKDIYYEIKITKDEKEYTFFIWYMRNEQETRTQIQDALFPSKNNTKNSSPLNTNNNSKQNNSTQNSTNYSNSINKGQTNNAQKQQGSSNGEENSLNPFSNLYNQNSNSASNVTNSSNENEMNNTSSNYNNNNNSSDNRNNNNNNLSNNSSNAQSTSKQTNFVNSTQTQNSCDNYLFEQGYTIIEKEKHSLGNVYKVSIKMNEFTLVIDCLSIEQKKVQMKEILEFYTSSIRPKIIFHTTLPKKIQSTIEELENCFIIEIKS